MLRRRLCKLVALCAAAILAAGSGGARLCAAATRVHPAYSLPSEGYDVSDVALSPTGRWLAVVTAATVRSGSYGAVYAYDVTSGKLLRRFVGGWTMLAAWHPSRPLLAIANELAESETELRVLDMTTGEARYLNPDGYGGYSHLDWLPDGQRVLTEDGYYESMRGGEPPQVPGLWGLPDLEAITIASDWTVAAERPRPWRLQLLSRIELYRKKPGALAYSRTAVLWPGKDRSGRATDFRTRPAFLSSGRLGYVRVFLDRRGQRRRVEVWTCRRDGKDERKWLSLPVIPPQTKYSVATGDPSLRRYRLSAISWSRNGGVIAYVYRGRIIVKQVKPPAAH
jgi:WD40 repeat protein